MKLVSFIYLFYEFADRIRAENRIKTLHEISNVVNKLENEQKIYIHFANAFVTELSPYVVKEMYY